MDLKGTIMHFGFATDTTPLVFAYMTKQDAIVAGYLVANDFVVYERKHPMNNEAVDDLWLGMAVVETVNDAIGFDDAIDDLTTKQTQELGELVRNWIIKKVEVKQWISEVVYVCDSSK